MSVNAVSTDYGKYDQVYNILTLELILFCL